MSFSHTVSVILNLMADIAAKMAIAALVVHTVAAQVSPVRGWFLSGANARAYEVVLDRETYRGGSASAMIRCRQRRCSNFATLMQTIQADEYLEHRIRFSGWVKATKGGAPRLWMRIDGASGETLAFDNMDNRSKPGPFDWRYLEIVLDVEKPAALINFGLINDGNGSAWVDDMTLEVVQGKSRSTDQLQGPTAQSRNANSVRKTYYASKPRPVNLDFEEQPTR